MIAAFILFWILYLFSKFFIEIYCNIGLWTKFNNSIYFQYQSAISDIITGGFRAARFVFLNKDF